MNTGVHLLIAQSTMVAIAHGRLGIKLISLERKHCETYTQDY